MFLFFLTKFLKPQNAQPIRLLLAYTKTKYRERNYNFGNQTDKDRSEWLKEKFNLDLDFPNVNPNFPNLFKNWLCFDWFYYLLFYTRIYTLSYHTTSKVISSWLKVWLYCTFWLNVTAWPDLRKRNASELTLLSNNFVITATNSSMLHWTQILKRLGWHILRIFRKSFVLSVHF